MQAIKFTLHEGPMMQDFDNLHINKGKLHITGYLNVYRFVDKDTRQHVIYIPSLELSGYGETSDKATEMAKEALSEFLGSMLHRTSSEVMAELSDLGWKKNMFRNKDFSNHDIAGKLKHLNADNDKVEHLALVA